MKKEGLRSRVKKERLRSRTMKKEWRRSRGMKRRTSFRAKGRRPAVEESALTQ
jgi:hypothetical protein